MIGARLLANRATEAHDEAERLSDLGGESSLSCDLAKLRRALYEIAFAITCELEQLRGEIKRK